jgi:hypothetical protein
MMNSGVRVPLSLYRAILKVHRMKLPVEMKELGMLTLTDYHTAVIITYII